MSLFTRRTRVLFVAALLVLGSFLSAFAAERKVYFDVDGIT